MLWIFGLHFFTALVKLESKEVFTENFKNDDDEDYYYYYYYYYYDDDDCIIIQ